MLIKMAVLYHKFKNITSRYNLNIIRQFAQILLDVHDIILKSLYKARRTSIYEVFDDQTKMGEKEEKIMEEK